MKPAELLRSAGLRCTKARESLLTLLCEAMRPLSHQDITTLPGAQHLDRVTIYRTLAALEEAGLVHRVRGMDAVWRYRGHNVKPDGCPGNHSHFLCLSCNVMYCLDDEPLPRVAVPKGAEVKGKQLVVYGNCPDCASAA